MKYSVFSQRSKISSKYFDRLIVEMSKSTNAKRCTCIVYERNKMRWRSSTALSDISRFIRRRTSGEIIEFIRKPIIIKTNTTGCRYSTFSAKFNCVLTTVRKWNETVKCHGKFRTEYKRMRTFIIQWRRFNLAIGLSSQPLIILCSKSSQFFYVDRMFVYVLTFLFCK